MEPVELWALEPDAPGWNLARLLTAIMAVGEFLPLSETPIFSSVRWVTSYRTASEGCS